MAIRNAQNKAAVRDRLHLIPTLARSDLIDHWIAAHGRPPPKAMSRRLLEYACAYTMQSKAFGPLTSATRRKLNRRENGKAKTTRQSAPAKKSKSPAPGTRLIREWHGRTYIVDVVESAYRWNGHSYSSLSHVARAITGARWSGPRFFGL